jgi:regulator of replication initiation timing
LRQHAGGSTDTLKTRTIASVEAAGKRGQDHDKNSEIKNGLSLVWCGGGDLYGRLRPGHTRYVDGSKRGFEMSELLGTATAEEKIAELESKIEDLEDELKETKEENDELRGDLEDLEKENDELRGDLEDLEKEKDQLERDNDEIQSRSTGAEEIQKALELYADPANWDSDRRFVPVMRHIDADIPSWPAEQALKAAGI